MRWGRFIVLAEALVWSASGAARGGEAGGLTLWYQRPAQRWLEALPVGNGRLGAMVFGGVEHEELALNESTVWSGGPGDRRDDPSGAGSLAEIRRLFFTGHYIEGRDLCARHLLGREENYGTHLPMGRLRLDFKPGGEARDYRRELDLREGVARVAYSVDGARFTREVLASNPDGVLVARLGCDRPGRLSFALGLNSGDLPGEVRAMGEHTLVMTGRAFEQKHSDGKTGVKFECWARVLNDGGRVQARDGGIEVEGADSVTVIVAANTDYHGREPTAECRRETEGAARETFARLRARHEADYKRLFDRVELDLGGADAPTDQRVAATRAGGDDPALCALFFQYGRYLMISGSRENSPLPTNLQGIWNDNLACKMGWTCDFHLDINTEQNYWPAEVCNLGECHEPLFRLVESLREPGRRTARVMYGARGWVCHVFTNPWGFTSPGWSLGWGLHPTGGIWIASDLWEHFLFTGDRAFLARRAYPVLREAADFFLDYMAVDPRSGWLVTGPSDSPENTFITPDGRRCSESMGPTCDRALVFNLFGSCIEASQTLGVDAEFRAKLAAARLRLSPLRAGRHGQLMEWLEDFEEAEPNHRHTSHLIALYPMFQITPRETPELARAARVTLDRRLGRKDWEDVEWSRGNAINFYARLGDGEMARAQLLGLLSHDTEADLLTFSRGGIAGAAQNIFAIDGNFSGAAGVAEMLLQSHGGEIQLLPALPNAWSSGSVRGLRARGGFEAGVTWRGGALEKAEVKSLLGGPLRLRWREKVVNLKTAAGQTLEFDRNLRSRAPGKRD